MANQKISALTALAGASIAADDLGVVVDTSAAQTKSVRQDVLLVALARLGMAASPVIFSTVAGQVGLRVNSITANSANLLEFTDTDGTTVRTFVGNQGLNTRGLRVGNVPTPAPVYDFATFGGNLSVAAGSTATFVRMAANTALSWTTTSDNPDATADSGFARLAAKVIKATDGSTALGWVQTEGTKRTSTAPTNATATMSNLTDLTETVAAGRKYGGFLTVIAKNSTAVEGLQFDFNGGAATMTTFQATLVGTPLGTTPGVTTVTALGTALTVTTATTTDVTYLIYVTFVVNAGGTFIPRFAEVSHTTGTATVEIGATLKLDDIP